MVRAVKTLYHLISAVLANVWYGFPARKLTVIGVTGTDGKTTTSTLIYEILFAAGHKTSLVTSVSAVIAGVTYDTGFHVTTPSSFQIQKLLRRAVDHGDTHVVLETTSHGLSQYRVWGIPFVVGVLTNITHEHLDWHGTLDRYIQIKLSLLTRARIAVINRDEAEVYERFRQKNTRNKVIAYGIRRKAMVTPTSYPFRTQLPGLFNRYNCLAAIAVSVALGLNTRIVTRAIAAFPGVPGRMEYLQKTPFAVIVDFAHTPNALAQALSTVRAMTRKQLIHVFGSAGLRDRSKRSLMGAVSAKYADQIILTEEDCRTEDPLLIMKEIGHGIPPGFSLRMYPSRRDALSYALSVAQTGDTVLVTGKGHEQSLCRGMKEYPWSDQKEIRNLLRKIA